MSDLNEITIPVIQSQGGPYDDTAFAAGWLTKECDDMLGSGHLPTGQIPHALLPMFEQLATRHEKGLLISGSDDIWTHFAFINMRVEQEAI